MVWFFRGMTKTAHTPAHTPADTWLGLIEAHRDLIDRDEEDEVTETEPANLVIPVFHRSKHRRRLLVTSIAE